MTGAVYLAGAGPGDPGLLTLRGRELLAACDVVVYDALVAPELLDFARPEAERIYAGKRGGQHTLEQDEINALLVSCARAGKNVVRLKGGDPYLFGRGAEEALALAEAGVPFEVVPGVTAGLAATAYAGIPLTHRGLASAVAFVTGHEDPTKPASALDWAALAKVGTLCLYMGVKKLPDLARELAKHLSPATPAAVIQWGTTPRQRTVTGTLENLAARAQAAGLSAPALVVVGEVVRLREQLAFFERRPLFGRRVVVTRARAQASELATLLVARGAEVITLPAIRIEPPRDARALAAAVRRLGEFDWVVLTSVNGVDALCGEVERQGGDARAFGTAQIAAIGPATAARLAQHGLRADLTPANFVAEEIVRELEARGAFGPAPLDAPGDPDAPRMALDLARRPPRFLLARGDLARRALAELLRARGAGVTDVIAYRTVPESAGQEAAVQALLDGTVDAVAFTSGSTARNFADALGPARLKQALASQRLKCFSIGPITSATMRELALPIHAEAARHDLPGLVEAVVASFAAATPKPGSA